MAAERKFVGQPTPVPYQLDTPGEVYRLMSECWGYLHTCHSKHGTDWQGRQYAMDALKTLSEGDWRVVCHPPAPAPVKMRAENTPELIERARLLVIEKPSTSYMQRKLNIGYNQACELMEHFESLGIVSAASASGVRTVLTKSTDQG